MNIKVDHITILIGLIMFASIVSPIFEEGYPLNTDLMPQYLRLHCLDNSLENNPGGPTWCPDVNAGVPTSEYYYPTIDKIVVLLGWFVGLLLAYKLLLIASIIIPAYAIWLWIRRKNRIAAGLAFVAYLFFTAGWHGGGFEETLLVGFWHYMLSIGFLFIGLYYFTINIGNRWEKKALVPAFLTLFILHPMTLLVAIFCYLTIFIYSLLTTESNNDHFRDKHDDIPITNKIIDRGEEIVDKTIYMFKFILLSLLFNAFYILPLIERLKYFPTSVGGTLDWSMLMGYIINPIPTILWILAITGVVTTLIFKIKKWNHIMALTGMFSVYVILEFFKNPLTDYLIGVRIGAFIGIMVIILAAIGGINLTRILKKYIKNLVGIAMFFIGFLVIMSMYSNLQPMSEMFIMSSDEELQPMIGLYESLDTLPQGRILMEETLYTMGKTKESFTHMTSLVPVLTNKEIIGFCPTIFPKLKPINLLDTTGPSLFGTNVEDWEENELREVLDRYNIRFLLVHSENYKNLLDKSFESIDVGPFKLYNTGTSGSYFRGNGIVEEDYNGYAGKVKIESNETQLIMFKVNAYANWKATYQKSLLDKPVDIDIIECDQMVCVPSNATGYIEIKYENTKYDVIGFIISFFTFFIGIIIYVGDKWLSY